MIKLHIFKKQNLNWIFSLKQVSKGKITTYKLLANAINTKVYQAVGNVMNKNPYALEIPCHRVVNQNGNIRDFAQGTEKKIKMLEREGIKVKPPP